MTSWTSRKRSEGTRPFGVVRIFATLAVVVAGTLSSLASLAISASPSAAAAPDTVTGGASGLTASLLGTTLIPPTPAVTTSPTINPPDGATPACATATSTCTPPNVETATSPLPSNPLLGVANFTVNTQSVNAGQANQGIASSVAGSGIQVGGTTTTLPSVVAVGSVESECAVDAFGAKVATSTAEVLTVGGMPIPIPTGINQTVPLPAGIPSVIGIEANVQTATASPVGNPPSASITVDALVITVLGISPGTAVLQIVIGSVTCGVSGPDMLPQPTVTGVSPTYGPAAGGNTVTITGTNFSDGSTPPFTPTVDFGTNAATNVTVVSPTTITATAPAGAGTPDVTVTTYVYQPIPSSGPPPTPLSVGTSGTTAADKYNYIGPPTIGATGLSPTSGSTMGGTQVTITGTNFIAPVKVTFGGNQATNVTQPATPSTSITAVTPAGTAGPVAVVVTTPNGSATAAQQFTYILEPGITSILPTFGPVAGGTPVVITGGDFQNGDTVNFGSTPAMSASYVNPTTFDAVSPAGSGTVDVTVSQGALTSPTGPGDLFSYVGSPTVTGVSPGGGPTSGGTQVTITGTNFTPGSIVNFGPSNPATVVSQTLTTLVVTAPPGNGTVDVTVTTPIATSATNSSDLFSYAGAPVITGLSPTSGATAGGYMVEIVGDNLCAPTTIMFGNNAVSQGTENAPQCTILTVQVPAGTGTVPVTVTTQGGTATAPEDFTYINPGYWMVATDGGIFAFGGAQYYGSMGGRPLNQPIVAMADTPDHGGYWLFAADGGVFAFGDAGYYGSVPGVLGPQHRTLNAPIVAAQASPDGHGYRMFAADGGVFDFGDVPYVGSLPGSGVQVASPIVGAASAPIGQGYWLVGRDGGVFTFGTATFQGSAAGIPNLPPIVSLAPTTTDNGYWLVTNNGQVYYAGDAQNFGEVSSPIASPIVYATSTSTSNGTSTCGSNGQSLCGGYWLFGRNGAVYSFGDAPYLGSLPQQGVVPSHPIVGGIGF